MKNDLSGMRYSKQRELILQQVQELQDHPRQRRSTKRPSICAPASAWAPSTAI